ncbi:hypothetical protein ACP4OV_027249 [Aristida adscensionis]
MDGEKREDIRQGEGLPDRLAQIAWAARGDGGDDAAAAATTVVELQSLFDWEAKVKLCYPKDAPVRTAASPASRIRG